MSGDLRQMATNSNLDARWLWYYQIGAAFVWA
ncbi:hypothetical protein SM11_pC0927 (plasmid) [Sinorhizobium meliloti SM11]|uniref:Uncharacterized protein n=1 Tax=Sinorhizobium meliloti (strain SM11) TaxID=707241 RepID=F7XEM5_SINMM|nr:hypothetical protein SM11_pC0927 [Sinorhizobium meliloti SM11]